MIIVVIKVYFTKKTTTWSPYNCLKTYMYFSTSVTVYREMSDLPFWVFQCGSDSLNEDV